MHCIHANCTQSHLIRNIDEHESICSMKGTKFLYNVTTKSRVFKLPLHSVSAKHTRHRRLKPIISQVNEFCNAQEENKSDVLFFMLKDHLKEINDPRWKQVESLWLGNNSTLSPEQCLALRVDLLQSKGQYRSQYDFLSQNNVHVFQAPSKMESCENLFMPSASIFQIIDNDGNVLLQNSENPCTEPLNVNECFLPGFVELATPNCMGVRFSYFEALSLTLQELEPEILFGLKKHGLNIEDVLFLTTVKDGCDGMGEVSVYKEKDFKMLPDKAFRFSFCIVKIQAEYDGKLFDVFTEPLPNSVRTNRTSFRINF